MAQEYVPADANFVSTRTRAEVAAEVEQAYADGTLRVSEYAYPVMNVELTKSRADVRAELERAHADGTAEFREDTYPVIRLAGPAKTREQVRAELAQRPREHVSSAVNGKQIGG